jgi:two-component system OmpR family response regulator
MRTNQPTQILVVDDDPELRDLLREYLTSQGFAVSVLHDGDGLQARLERERPALIVLDLMMPKVDGLTALRNLRAKNDDIPVILLTARSDEIDRIVGLEIGADDYLGKPFNPRELLARIRAILRRKGSEPQDGDGARRFHFSGWTLDVGLRQVLSPEGARIAITGAEFDLLHALCLRPGRVLSRDQLLDLTQGRAAGPFERSIDVLVSRIRQKIERDPRNPEIIRTIRSGGYLFAPEIGRS